MRSGRDDVACVGCVYTNAILEQISGGRISAWTTAHPLQQKSTRACRPVDDPGWVDSVGNRMSRGEGDEVIEACQQQQQQNITHILAFSSKSADPQHPHTQTAFPILCVSFDSRKKKNY